MKILHFPLTLAILLGLITFFQPQFVFAFQIKDEKLKEIISKIMTGNERPVSESEQEKVLKEYEVFLDQFEISNSQQAEELIHLGNLILTIEENEIQKNPSTLSKYPKIYTFSKAIYEKLRSSFVESLARDEVLYQLAHAYEKADQKEKSLLLLKELVTKFPKSVYYPEAQFRIGESYFNEGKYPEALESYMKAVESNPSAPLIDFISYKLIWSYFKIGDYRKSVDLIVTVLNRYSIRQKNGISILDIESLSESNWKQVKELLHLATLSVDFWGGSEKVRIYFDFHGHVSYENLIYRPLGHLYMNRGKFQEAAQTFNTFLALYPTHEDAPLFQMDLIETYQKADRLDLVKEARETLIENYKPESTWWKANSRMAQQKISLLRKEILYQQAQSYHAEAQKSKKRDDYLIAITSYQKFISNFSKELEAPRIQFFLGEAFFETGQYEQAATAYEISAYQYPLHLYSQEAGFAALISYEKAILSSQNTSDATRLILLKSCQTFLKNFPDSVKKQAVLFKAMTLAFQTRNTGEGIAYAQQILNTPPNNVSTEIIVKTHYLLGKSYFDDQDLNDAETEFKQTLAWCQKPDYHETEGPAQEEVRAFLASILYKRADSLKNQLKWKDAGLAFYHLFEELPGSELAPISLMNSGGSFLEIKDYDSAVNSFSKLTTRYPESPYFLEAESAMTTIYEKRELWNDAAKGYEVLISKTADPEKKYHYLDQLYSLYFKGGNWSRLYQDLVPSFQDHSINNAKWIYYFAISAKEIKKEPETLLAVNENISLLKKNQFRSPDEEEWVMKSALLKGNILNDEFILTNLAPPIEKSLPLKKEKLKEVMDTFAIAAQSTNPEIASEALYHIGNLFEQFASDLSHSERPKDLTVEQKEIYEELLKNQINPLYQKAIEVYKKNLNFSDKIENDWIRRSEARYRQLILENRGPSS